MDKVKPSMSKLIPTITELVTATVSVNDDEKAWAYLEVEEQSPGSHGFHRYRIIYVNRNGNIAEYRDDMGEAKNFKGAKKAIHIPSVWEHSVAELIDIADYLRWETQIDIHDWLEIDDMKLK